MNKPALPAKFLTVVVSAFVLFVCLADAEVYEIPLECPFCSQEFNGLQSGDTEYNAGIDSDFCPYSLTGSTRSFQVQTCPHCGYSAYTQRFLAGRPVPEADRRTLKPELERIMQGRKLKDQQKVPIALKFKLVLAVMEHDEKPLEERARTAHLAAWAVRDKITFRALKTEYRLPIQAFEAFERRMKKLSLDSPDAVAAALETLQLAVRLGLPASRKAIEKRILSQGTENFDGFQRQRLEQAMQEFRRDAEDEAFFLVRAAELFEKALAREGVKEEDAENFTYLSGELYRRAGMAEKAANWLKKALEKTERIDLKKLIPVLLEHCEDHSAAAATEQLTMTCPLCGNKTPVLKPIEPDLLGGTDTDFATYSLEPAAYDTLVVSCVHCLYTRFRGSFEDQFPGEHAKALNKILEPYRKKISATSPGGFKSWQRYELAAVCEKASGGDANSVGMFYLNAAWAARRALCSPTLEVDISTRMLMPDLARKLAKQKADGAFDGYYIAFLLCRRAGLADRAKHYFDKAEDMVAGYELRETLLRTASKLVEVENGYLRLAVEQFSAKKPEGEDAEFYSYVHADAMRRLGKDRKARVLFEKCVDLPRVGSLARTLLEEL